MEQERYTVNEYNGRMLGKETGTLGDLPGSSSIQKILRQSFNLKAKSLIDVEEYQIHKVN